MESQLNNKQQKLFDQLRTDKVTQCQPFIMTDFLVESNDENIHIDKLEVDVYVVEQDKKIAVVESILLHHDKYKHLSSTIKELLNCDYVLILTERESSFKFMSKTDLIEYRNRINTIINQIDDE